MGVQVRVARPEEGEALRQIAFASKGHWGYDPEFLARFADIISFSSGQIRENEVRVVEVDRELVGFYGVIHQGEVSELDIRSRQSHRAWLASVSYV
jgi:hypothetical protein